MTALMYDVAALRVLWRRDMLRFWRQPVRLVGALGQPIIFWLVIGSGMAATFKVPGLSLDYFEFFYPGVVLMVALFASIFASVSIIEDRHQGFLQAILAGPASRGALVLGKCLGSASVALVQIAGFMALAPLAGFDINRIDWGLLTATLVACTVALSALGFAIAWWLDNVQAYHAIQMTFLVPLWVLSGAMFPLDAQQPAFFWIMTCNPVAYAVSAVRHALYGGVAPAATVMPMPALQALLVVLGFAVASLLLATIACRRR